MKPQTIIERWGGLGDVCMALAAAKALSWAGQRVGMVTAPEYQELVKACPHVSWVSSTWPENLGQADRCFDLGNCKFGLSKMHQVDAYLEETGLHDPRPGVKTIDLFIEEDMDSRIGEVFPGDGWVALHPSVGDPNRTWAADRWATLARRLQEDGFNVLTIGSASGPDGKGALQIPGVRCAFGLTPLETVALLHRCRALVSCDSGPIQLAGATRCSVVGIYSVVEPECRMPFRFPGTGIRDVAVPCYCPHAPCYQGILDPAVWNEIGAPQRAAGVHLGKIFADWCLLGENTEPFACMKGLAVQTVHAAIKGVLA